MNKQEIIKIIEKVENKKCPLRTKKQTSCYIDCKYNVSANYGNVCLFSEFVEALDSEENFEV